MATLIEAESSARVQYAILSASAYAATSEICKCVEPLVLPTAMDGSRGFHAIMLARADSPIQKLDDTDGARLALGAADFGRRQSHPVEGIRRRRHRSGLPLRGPL